MSKQIVSTKIVVPAVRLAQGHTQAVKFVAKARWVTVKSSGVPTMKVRQAKGIDSDKFPFEALARGDKHTVVAGKTPADAFARGVKAFWN